MINTIYTENCLITLRKMPHDFIDLVVTSPPYDNLRKYDTFQFDFEAIALELYRPFFFKSCGFNLHDTMIYKKKNFLPLTHRRYEQAFEYMFVFSKGSVKTFNAITEKCLRSGEKKNYSRAGSCVKEGGYRRRSETITTRALKIKNNIFEYATGGTKSEHPAPFPNGLARDQILSWSNEKDIVYDPFAGSGSVPVEARRLSRSYLASEISTAYSEIIKKKAAGIILFRLNCSPPVTP